MAIKIGFFWKQIQFKKKEFFRKNWIFVKKRNFLEKNWNSLK